MSEVKVSFVVRRGVQASEESLWSKAGGRVRGDQDRPKKAQEGLKHAERRRLARPKQTSANPKDARGSSEEALPPSGQNTRELLRITKTC